MSRRRLKILFYALLALSILLLCGQLSHLFIAHRFLSLPCFLSGSAAIAVFLLTFAPPGNFLQRTAARLLSGGVLLFFWAAFCGVLWLFTLEDHFWALPSPSGSHTVVYFQDWSAQNQFYLQRGIFKIRLLSLPPSAKAPLGKNFFEWDGDDAFLVLTDSATYRINPLTGELSQENTSAGKSADA